MPKPVSRDAEKSVSLWHPFRIATFRNLLAADVASDVGTFMQNVGAAWLMLSLSAGPLLVALTQTASSLPALLRDSGWPDVHMLVGSAGRRRAQTVMR